jgi:hypothetical protein
MNQAAQHKFSYFMRHQRNQSEYFQNYISYFNSKYYKFIFSKLFFKNNFHQNNFQNNFMSLDDYFINKKNMGAI